MQQIIYRYIIRLSIKNSIYIIIVIVVYFYFYFYYYYYYYYYSREGRSCCSSNNNKYHTTILYCHRGVTNWINHAINVYTSNVGITAVQTEEGRLAENSNFERLSNQTTLYYWYSLGSSFWWGYTTCILILQTVLEVKSKEVPVVTIDQKW